jgi:pyruvate dehydrogenase E1 component alpha subunit
LHHLPIVFVCENNLYSVYSPMSVRQPAHREVYQQALGHGMKASQVDGNNPQAVYEAANEAVSYARARKGPVFLECKTYRWREHCGHGFDNHIGYRAEAEFLDWKERDPIATWERQLEAEGAFTPQRLEVFRAGVRDEIAKAFAAAESACMPDPKTLMHAVLA